MDKHAVVLITAPSVEVARRLGRELLEQRLAACVTIDQNVESHYVWEGGLHRDQEVLMLVKTTASAVEALSEVIRKTHPYDVPEIIALPVIWGAPDYLRWIDQAVDH